MLEEIVISRRYLKPRVPSPGASTARALLCALGAAGLLIPGIALAQTTTYEYDNLGRLRSKTYPGGAVSTTYVLDAVGNRIQVVTGSPGSAPPLSLGAGTMAGADAITAGRPVPNRFDPRSSDVGPAGAPAVESPANDAEATARKPPTAPPGA